MLRLNLDVAPTARETQINMGVIAGFTKGVLDAAKSDLAGFPNGRRVGDDVVDIELRVAMGKLLTPDVAPAGDAPFTDGATVNARMFPNKWPYLNSPFKGSPNDPTITITPKTSATVDGKYKPVAALFDPATRTLTVPKPDATTGFLQLKSDGPVKLGTVQTTPDSLKAKIE